MKPAASAFWPKVELGDHVDLLTGHPFRSSEFTEHPEDVRLLRGDNVAQGRLRWSNAKHWSKHDLAPYKKFELRFGDVILAMDRPWIPAGLKYGWVTRTDTPSLLVQRVARMRGTSKLLTDYIRYIIGSHAFVGHVQGIITGVNVPHISARDIRSFRFRLPPLPVQRRIAAILSAYDDLIENNTRRIAILEEMARRLYEEWFVHFRFPGHEQVRMVESDLGPIPEGWKPACLGDLAHDKREGVQPGSVPADTPCVGLEHIPRRSITLREWGTAAGVNSLKLRFRRGHILFGKIRPYFHKVSVAPMDGLCSSDTIVIEAKRRDWFPLVVCCASSHVFVEHATQTSNGTKMPRANWYVLLRYPIPLPSPDLLDQFNGIVDPVIELTQTLARQNTNLRAQRDLLLPKLISGEIDVSEVGAPEADAEAA